jgi:hypothetical protein
LKAASWRAEASTADTLPNLFGASGKAAKAEPGAKEQTMSPIQIVAAILFVIVLYIIIRRRKSKASQ